MLAYADTNTDCANRDIKFLEVRHLNGPNIWTLRPVLEAIVDIGDLEDFPSNTIPGFYERLYSWLPSLIEHRCSYGERGGFLRRLKDGTWAGHILEHITLELQNLAGMPGGFGRARETSLRGVYKVAVSAWHENIARSALSEARELVLAAMGYLQPATRPITSRIPSSACATWWIHSGWAHLPPVSSRPPPSAIFPPSAFSPRETSCNSAMVLEASVYGQPRPTSRRPLPKVSRGKGPDQGVASILRRFSP